MDDTTTWSLRDSLRERFRHATGTPVEHDIRPYFDVVAKVDAIAVDGLTDDELRAWAASLHARARAREQSGESLDDLLPEVFAVAREASAPTPRTCVRSTSRWRRASRSTGLPRPARHRRRQDARRSAAGDPPRARRQRRAHLHGQRLPRAARRRVDGPALRGSSACVRPPSSKGMTPEDARQAYDADVTYVTAKEAGFDFLRDHTATEAAAVVHRGHESRSSTRPTSS